MPQQCDVHIHITPSQHFKSQINLLSTQQNETQNQNVALYQIAFHILYGGLNTVCIILNGTMTSMR